jgi:hypothetical protein
MQLRKPWRRITIPYGTRTDSQALTKMTTVAVMQPYFVPYAGYYRLFAAADIFVAFDCVQFPRRGWVHRNQFSVAPGATDWLTLPIQKCDRSTRIADLALAPDAEAMLHRSVQRFPILKGAWNTSSPLIDSVKILGAGTVADYLCGQLASLAALLGVSRPIVRSSSLGIPADVHGQARVIAIAGALGATRYVNSPGGRSLYQPEAFNEQGIELRFLSPFTGSTDSILSVLLTDPVERVAALVRNETILSE